MFDISDVGIIAFDISPDGTIHFNGQDFDISEEIDHMEKTTWREFLLTLGYPDDQAEKWASGYATFLREAEDPLEKIRGLIFMHDPAIHAGFEATDIDTNEALLRYRAITVGPVGEA